MDCGLSSGTMPETMQRGDANPSPPSPRQSKLARFVYKPLESPRHIRLLRVLASSSDSTGEASEDHQAYELVHVSLEACHNIYQAVSYVWGNPTQNHAMKLGMTDFLPITETLKFALPQLAKMCSKGVLWIDQICIDQSNIQERGQQVSLMAEVYKNAAGVLIWAGDEVKGLSQMKSQLMEAGDCDPEHTSTLIDLFYCPWFSRGWTIQEAVLAKEATIIAGTCALAFEDIRRAWEYCIKFSSWSQDSRPKGRTSFEVITALRRGAIPISYDSGFDGLLNNFAEMQIFDKRDHVYAFLGLKNDPRIVIQPDYNASTSEVFTTTARAIIEGTGTLDCFRFLPPMWQSEDLILPSWVPNWSLRKTMSRILQDPTLVSGLVHPPFRAAKGFSHKVRLPSPRSGILKVSGRIIDTIELNLPTPCWPVRWNLTPKRYQPVETLPSFFGLSDEQVSFVDQTAFTDPNQTLRKRLMSVIVAGHLDPEEILAMYESEGKTSDNSPRGCLLIDQLERLWAHEVWVTESKKLVLVPSTGCDKGDVLAIVHGLDAPLLLKRALDGTFTVRGQCYLENAMFGEAVIWQEDEADYLLLS